MRNLTKSIGIIIAISIVFLYSSAYASIEEFSLTVGSVTDVDNVTIGETAIVPITLNRSASADMITGIGITLSYNPDIIHALTDPAEAVQMLKVPDGIIPADGTGNPYWNYTTESIPPDLWTPGNVIFKVDNETGKLRLAIFDMSGDDNDPDGNPLDASGIILNIKFEAVGAGTSNLEIVDPDPNDDIHGYADLAHLYMGTEHYEVGEYDLTGQTGAITQGEFVVSPVTSHNINLPTPPDPATGTINITPNPVPEGSECTITVMPVSYYRVDDLRLDESSVMDSVSIDATTGMATYVLANVTQAHDIDAAIGIFYGDANGSHGINWSDAIRVLEHDCGINPLTGPALQAGDANESGGVNWSDAIRILDIDAGR